MSKFPEIMSCHSLSGKKEVEYGIENSVILPFSMKNPFIYQHIFSVVQIEEQEAFVSGIFTPSSINFDESSVLKETQT